MKIEIKTEDAASLIDSVELAIGVMEQLHRDEQTLFSTGKCDLRSISKAVEDLQMLRVSLMLLKRKASQPTKEIERFDRHAHDAYFDDSRR